MTTLTTTLALWISGFVLGLVAGASRRRPTCRELMRDPNRQPTFAELLMPKAQPAKAAAPYWQRSYINNPVEIAECDGPCQ